MHNPDVSNEHFSGSPTRAPRQLFSPVQCWSESRDKTQFASSTQSDPPCHRTTLTKRVFLYLAIARITPPLPKARAMLLCTCPHGAEYRAFCWLTDAWLGSERLPRCDR